MRASFVAFVALSLLTSVAHAHGRPPRVERITFDPNDTSRFVLTTTSGLVETEDGGVTWRWICASAFGADPTQEEPDAQIVDDGSIVLATFDGIARGEPDLCGFTFPPGESRDVYVVDLERDPSDASRVLGVASSGSVADRVIVSEDDGRTWTSLSAPIPEILVERIVIAPSDPSRVYLGGGISSPTAPQAFVLRSDDGGQTFAQVELPLIDGERRAEVVGVDPMRPDRLFVRMARGRVDPRNERLLVSEDGGATFTPILELPSLVAFTISDDGRTLWAGSSTGAGLWVAREGATVFEQVNDVDVPCLAYEEGALYVCVDQIRNGFALGRSTDDGVTLEQLLRLQDATMLPGCARCSTTEIVCPAWLPDLFADYATYLEGLDAGMTGLPRDAGIPDECRPDAGPLQDAGPPPPPPPAGCGCSVPAAPRSPWALAPLAAIALVVHRVRARRDRRGADR